MKRTMVSRPLLASILLTFAGVAHADPVRVFAAGSLAGVMSKLITASGLSAGSVAPPVFGPAGLLRQRIESGEAVDLYASADLAQPQRLADEGRSGPAIPFARNRLCLIASKSLDLTPAKVLDAMLDPKVRLATSTPGTDPGGDYAVAVFARAEVAHPGAQATLDAKAQHLFGGPTAMVPSNGHTPGGAILLSGRADAVLYYCSGAADVVKEVPDTVAVPLPSSLEVNPVYGLSVLGNNPDAMRLALFLVSEPGQAILAKSGLLPILSRDAPAQPALAEAAAPSSGIRVTGLDGTSKDVSLAELQALPATSVTLPGEHGAPLQVSGPALWEVLQKAGAIDPNFHKRVRQTITVKGNDGYSSVLAAGEIDPEFENKQVIVGLISNGAAMKLPRLAIPGDKRLGRDVRDVASITVN